MMGIAHDNKKPYKRTTECHECGEKFKKGESKQILKIYDDPWADQPRTIAVHDNNDDDRYGSCLDKMTDTSWGDFRYFLCERCNRLIIQQCPDNGWRSYVKNYGDGRQICVACYQKEILENGQDKETLKKGAVPGDFFNHSELSNFNWVKVNGLDYIRIATTEQGKELCDKALAKIAEGFKVLINYESMAIGGLEGYVSLYIKK